MPKGKLILPASVDAKKVEVAAYFSNVKTGESLLVNDELHLEVSYPVIDNLVKFGGHLKTVKGNELDAKKAAQAEKAAKTNKK